MASVNSREDYLKRYLDAPKRSKSKKKKRESESCRKQSRFKIVDEDIDMKKIEVSFKEDDESDEAPLIVNVIDERPEEVKVGEMYSSKYWKKLDSSVKVKYEKLTESTEKCNSTSNFSLINGIKVEIRDSSEDDLSPLRRSSVKLSSDGLQKSPRHQNMPIVQHDSDLSPPRLKNIATSDSDLSPPRSKNLPRVKNIATSDSDLSPPRNKNLPRVKNIATSDSDLSPPRSRINDHHRIQGDYSPPIKVKNRHHKEDFSPPRYKGENHHYRKRGSSHSRNINKTDDQYNVQKNSSLSRSKSKDQHIKLRDFSPHRRKAEKWCYKQRDVSLSNRKTERNSKYSPDSFRKSRSQMQHSSDSDFSPPRERRCDDNEKIQAKHMESCKPSQYSSPLEKQHSKRMKKRHDSDSDNSFNSDKHYGTKRKNVKQLSKRMKKRHDSDSDNGFSSDKEQNSAKRKNVSYLYDANSQSPVPKSKPYRMEEESLPEPHTSSDSGVKKKHSKSTLSGMKAGLQDSASLKEEIRNFKHREKTALDVLDDELSGRNAETISRDKDTGRKRNLKEERLEQKEKEKKNAEKLEKYLEWGKGLKQKDDQQKKIQEDLYEMSKPLARYVDDDDLERQLKNNLKEGDPMLEYMKKKRQKNQTAVSSDVPAYEGPPAPPNRFNIPPGYRWDGVDRSNGFEKSFFEKISNTKANEQQAYLWSIENM